MSSNGRVAFFPLENQPLWTAPSSAYVAGACQSQRLVHGCRHCEGTKLMAAVGTHTTCTIARVQLDKCTYTVQLMGTSTCPHTSFLTDLLLKRLAGCQQPLQQRRDLESVSCAPACKPVSHEQSAQTAGTTASNTRHAWSPIMTVLM